MLASTCMRPVALLLFAMAALAQTALQASDCNRRGRDRRQSGGRVCAARLRSQCPRAPTHAIGIPVAASVDGIASDRAGSVGTGSVVPISRQRSHPAAYLLGHSCQAPKPLKQLTAVLHQLFFAAFFLRRPRCHPASRFKSSSFETVNILRTALLMRSASVFARYVRWVNPGFTVDRLVPAG